MSYVKLFHTKGFAFRLQDQVHVEEFKFFRMWQGSKSCLEILECVCANIPMALGLCAARLSGTAVQHCLTHAGANHSES